MSLQVLCEINTVTTSIWALRALKILSTMYENNMSLQVTFIASSISALRAGERLLACVCTIMLQEMGLVVTSVRTAWTRVLLRLLGLLLVVDLSGGRHGIPLRNHTTEISRPHLWRNVKRCYNFRYSSFIKTSFLDILLPYKD